MNVVDYLTFNVIDILEISLLCILTIKIKKNSHNIKTKGLDSIVLNTFY